MPTACEPRAIAPHATVAGLLVAPRAAPSARAHAPPGRGAVPMAAAAAWAQRLLAAVATVAFIARAHARAAADAMVIAVAVAARL